MKHFFKFSTTLLLVSVFLLNSCKKESHDHEHNEEELITTLKLNFTPQGGGDVLNFVWEDLDGNPNTPPMVQNILLDKGKKYDVSVEVLNRSVNPEKDITVELMSEKESHRFYFIPTPANLVTISGYDKDANNVTVGLSSLWETAATAATEKLRVVLRHYAGNPPNKEENDPVDSPKASTDIDVEFPLEVK